MFAPLQRVQSFLGTWKMQREYVGIDENGRDPDGPHGPFGFISEDTRPFAST